MISGLRNIGTFITRLLIYFGWILDYFIIEGNYICPRCKDTVSWSICRLNTMLQKHWPLKRFPAVLAPRRTPIRDQLTVKIDRLIFADKYWLLSAAQADPLDETAVRRNFISRKLFAELAKLQAQAGRQSRYEEAIKSAPIILVYFARCASPAARSGYRHAHVDHIQLIPLHFCAQIALSLSKQTTRACVTKQPLPNAAG